MSRFAVLSTALAGLGMTIFVIPAAFAVEPPINTPNRTHNMLAAASPPDQAKALGAIVGCPARAAAFRLYDRSSNTAMWRVDCSNGTSSIVSVAADAEGSTKVLSCPALKAVANVDCFR